ncbi:MAG: hypothetical protein GQ525_09555 [Draconibacterium sp.]|nr:hypothetical protein [Draconibacterium sp.]
MKLKKSLTLNHRLSATQQSVKQVYSLASQFKNAPENKLSKLSSFFSYFAILIYSIFFMACPNDIGAQISKSSATNIGFTVTPLGKTYLPPQGRVAISGSKSCDGDGGPSMRNTDRDLLSWKKEGYFQRNRDVGQVFLAEEDIHLDALVIRIGPEENAVGAGAPGAELFLQFFEVIGEPLINDNGTPQGTDSKHGFSKNHRCDDFIDGITYKSIHIARGGIFPDLPPTMDKNENPTGNKTSIYQYLRFDLQGKDELVFKGGKRYAFMVGFVEPGPERTFAVGNWNHAKQSAPPSLEDKYDTYHNGWAVRREGDGTIPPTMIEGYKQPKDVALLEKLFHESLFKTPPKRFELPPASDGYPDVDTYRDLEFYIEIHTDNSNTKHN